MEEPSESQTEQVVCPFYLENRCRFGDQCRNAHPAELASIESPAADTDTHKQIKDRRLESKNSKRGDDHHHQRGSKTRMRPAAEVINRINWDPDLNAQDFLVVYLDRFAGLMAMPLTDFIARDQTATGQCDSAIPQHRIQQICYSSCRHVVWEKQSRTDFVFNSTDGCETTIQEFIQNVKNQTAENNAS